MGGPFLGFLNTPVETGEPTHSIKYDVPLLLERHVKIEVNNNITNALHETKIPLENTQYSYIHAYTKRGSCMVVHFYVC